VTPGDYPRSAMMRGQYTSAEFAGAIGPPSGPPPEFEAPDFFSAIQQQLGLKLEVAKDNVGVVVVDHMERTATEK
jgi:uncharacterized protein (TIGR03435 family)